jgi:hypothetical protein
MFMLTDGAEHLVEFRKPGGNIVRAFCGLCGSRILNRFPSWKPEGRTPLAFFPSLLSAETQRALPEVLRPQRDIEPPESRLDREALMRHFEATE